MKNKIALEKKDKKLYNFNIPDGGYFIFLYINDLVDINKVNELRSSYKVNFVNGSNTIPSMFNSLYPEFDQTIRLAISSVKYDILEESVEIFIKLLNDCIIR